MWNIEALTGYKPKTTFWEDFTIADHFGQKAIEDTFQRAFRDWESDCVYLTELVMVLNHKLWQWYEDGNERLARLYHRLWEQADTYACETLTGEDLAYFYSVTD